MKTWHVTVKYGGRVSSFFVEADDEEQAKKKALLSVNVTVEVKPARLTCVHCDDGRTAIGYAS